MFFLYVWLTALAMPLCISSYSTLGYQQSFKISSLGRVILPAHQTRNRRPAQTMSLGGLARKMKEKEIAPLLNLDPSDPIAQIMDARGSNPKKPSGELSQTLLRPQGAVSCIAEFRRKGNLGVIDEVVPPNIVSATFREARAHAVSVLLDATTGGCSVDDVREFVKEQNTAIGDYPGPMPLIVHDVVINEAQLAQASMLGAAGVTLSISVLGDEISSMFTAATEYGLEPVVVARSKEELIAAGAIEGVSIVAISGVAVCDIIDMVPDFPEGVVKVAFLPYYDDKQLIEAEDSWRLRDAGINSIWASEVLYKFTSPEDGDDARSIIKAIISKGSVKYARASNAYSGKGEGAKEFLGIIEM